MLIIKNAKIHNTSRRYDRNGPKGIGFTNITIMREIIRK